MDDSLKVKSDLWCAAVLLFRMLTGDYPFLGTSKPKLFENIMKCD